MPSVYSSGWRFNKKLQLESESIKVLYMKTLPKSNNCKFSSKISKSSSPMKLNSENMQ